MRAGAFEVRFRGVRHQPGGGVRPFPVPNIVGLSAAAFPLYATTILNIQAVEGCMVAYNQHHPRGPLYAPRYDVAGRAERWI
ncbi:MAG TPA: hypothetical protein VGL71_01385 [Urbifossiella sp.]